MRKPSGAPDSVHLAEFPEPGDLTRGLSEEHRKRTELWDRLIEVRETVLKSLEVARKEKFIGAPLEARVHLKANGDLYPLLERYSSELPSLFIVSEVLLENRETNTILSVHVERASGVKCERCWKYTKDVGSNPDLPAVCAACAAAVTEMLES